MAGSVGQYYLEQQVRVCGNFWTLGAMTKQNELEEEFLAAER
jgi:hypothetical protein